MEQKRAEQTCCPRRLFFEGYTTAEKRTFRVRWSHFDYIEDSAREFRSEKKRPADILFVKHGLNLDHWNKQNRTWCWCLLDFGHTSHFRIYNIPFWVSGGWKRTDIRLCDFLFWLQARHTRYIERQMISDTKPLVHRSKIAWFWHKFQKQKI